jgi:hypothetical protein
MTKTALVFSVILFLAAGPALVAQTGLPRAEVFGGFSYLPAGKADFPRDNSYGFQFSIAANVNRWFGVVGDFAGQYRTVTDLGLGYPGVTAKTSVYEYLAGPRFSIRREKYTVFFHGLIGGAKGNSGISGFSESGIAVGAGGGIDINLNDRIAIRAIQLDYIASFVEILEDNARFGCGIVIKLGGSPR